METTKKWVGNNPKLKERVLPDGNISLYLEYLGYHYIKDEVSGKVKRKAKRAQRCLHLYLLKKPKTPCEKRCNKNTYAFANKIRYMAEQELLGKNKLKNVIHYAK